MERPLYEKRFGSYYLIEKVAPNPVTNPDGERIIAMADQLAIAFDIAMMDDPSGALLLKHGSREFVETWVVEAREKHIASGSEFANEMAVGLRMVVLPKDFPCEEINRCLQNSSYLGAMLMKYMPEALALAAINAAGETGDFRVADTSEIDRYPEEVELFVDAVEKFLGSKKKGRIFVSDQSAVSDFEGRDHTIYLVLARALRVPVSRTDLVLDVCRRLRALKESS